MYRVFDWVKAGMLVNRITKKFPWIDVWAVNMGDHVESHHTNLTPDNPNLVLIWREGEVYIDKERRNPLGCPESDGVPCVVVWAPYEESPVYYPCYISIPEGAYEFDLYDWDENVRWPIEGRLMCIDTKDRFENWTDAIYTTFRK